MRTPKDSDSSFPFVIGPLSAAVGHVAGAAYTIPAREPRAAEPPVSAATAPGLPARTAA